MEIVNIPFTTSVSNAVAADLSLSAMAQVLQINASYLSTLFRKETGVTLTDYVNKKRIDHAVMLLNSSDAYIQNIASACGIPDVNYFTKLFKKYIGKTPKEYRKLIHGRA
ncbi:MAG: AraC family transcriptional regulator [Lachnospiraceae bacterium]|nr:AraC family transcriptional regulator [Lachnospiraceae bacterium]